MIHKQTLDLIPKKLFLQTTLLYEIFAELSAEPWAIFYMGIIQRIWVLVIRLIHIHINCTPNIRIVEIQAFQVNAISIINLTLIWI